MEDSERMLVLDQLARARVGYVSGLDLDKLDLDKLDQRGSSVELVEGAFTAVHPEQLARRTAHRRSPTCGDEFTVHLDVADAIICDVTWRGHGCVISQAAASALASAAPGLSIPAFSALAEAYLATIPADAVPLAGRPDLAGLAAFAGVGRFPLRAGCATLAWRTALDALGGDR